MTEFAFNLSAVMKERGLSVNAVHKFTGISQSSIYRYLDGSRNPKKETINQIAKGLNVDVSMLTYGNLTRLEKVKSLPLQPFIKFLFDFQVNYCNYCTMNEKECDYKCEQHIKEYFAKG